MTRADSDEIAGKHRYTTVMARIGGAPTTVTAPLDEPDADTGRADAERTDIVVLLEPVDEHDERDEHDDEHDERFDHADPAEPSADEHPTEEVAGYDLERVPEHDLGEPAEPGDPADPAAPASPRPRLVVAAVAAAVVAALVAAVVVITGVFSGSPDEVAPVAARPIPPVAPAPAASRAAVFGESVGLADGWTVRIDRPAALRDEEYAELPAGTDRAVRMLVTVRNDSDEARDSAGWSVKATAESRPVELLSADGYAGAEAPSRTLLPGAALTLAVAVPMPPEPADLQVEAARSGRPPAIFVGRA